MSPPKPVMEYSPSCLSLSSLQEAPLIKAWKDLEGLIWSLGDIFQKKQIIVDLTQNEVVTYILKPGISTGLSFLHVEHGNCSVLT